MCVHSLCDIVFHAVTHYEFDANLIRSGIIHERCERVPAIMGKMFHVELIHNCIEIRTNIGHINFCGESEKIILDMFLDVGTNFSGCKYARKESADD